MGEREALVQLRQLRRQLDVVMELLEAQVPPDVVVNTAVVALSEGVTKQALSSWARNHGPGAMRGPWRLLGREAEGGKRSAWRWQRTGGLASGSSGGTLSPLNGAR